MFYGIAAGATWAVETIILGIALSMAPFVSTEQAIFLAPFVSTFIHDAFSALWAALYNGVRGNLKRAARARAGLFENERGLLPLAQAMGDAGLFLCLEICGQRQKVRDLLRGEIKQLEKALSFDVHAVLLFY